MTQFSVGHVPPERMTPMHEEKPAGAFNAARLVDGSGRVMRKNADCPQCHAPHAMRIVGTGFGEDAKVLCGACGHHFVGETTI